MSRFYMLSVAIFVFLFSGCSHEERRQLSDVKPDVMAEVDYGLKYALNPQEALQYQPHLRMGATFEDGELYLAVQNKSSFPMTVGPQNFALISGLEGSGKPVEVTLLQTKAILTKFPVADLRAGDIASGTFKFPESTGDLTGRYIVFKHSDSRISASRCRISPKVE